MILKYVIEPGGYEPVRGHETDAGLDLRSPVDVWVHPGQFVKIDTLIRVAIPENYVGLITSKSGLMLKGITSRGTIDSHYRGTIGAILYNHSKEGYAVHKGDKLCQLVILPCVIPQLVRVDALDDTDRGENGFGSTGV
jgi:dUTP pyrophosphatase